MELPQYDPGAIESKWQQKWQDAGYFKPNMIAGRRAFAIQLPPPNVTGVLHMGHAFNQTVMDALVRYHRMLGENVCWIPGFDHSGIATQIVVERNLAAAGVQRLDLGREGFLAKVWEWKASSGDTMKAQMARLGCSADWSREYFTMDTPLSAAVTRVFVRLYNDGLIYRGKKLVNWDPKLGTAVSDLEVENIEAAGSLWEIKYQLQDDPQQFLTVATTRPETLLGDVAVAVHPDDCRYRHWVGKKVILPLTGRLIPVVADNYVDPKFGTGCVKITPAHDFNDYELGQRHQTPLINIFTLDGRISAEAEVFAYADNKVKDLLPLPATYAGLERFAARKKILADLADSGLLAATQKHTLTIPTGDRSGAVIEPMLTDQWFMAMTAEPKGGGKSLAALGAEAVTGTDKVSFIPPNWINTYNQWLSAPQDWCISRQLWWGHQIPAWYDAEGKIYVAVTAGEAQLQAGDKVLRRDEDVLDTWFSSALVPFSTLGWPEKTAELAAFLPSSVLVTGHEIIFFWVARMIMLTRYFTGKIPFHDVYIHGIVRDGDGRKMSKSEGNVIDPVDIIAGVDLETLVVKRTTGLRRPEKAAAIERETRRLFPDGIKAFGADALRFTMASYASLGRDINFDLNRCGGYRNFCNKIWQVSRFVLLHVSTPPSSGEQSLSLPYSFADSWILSRLQQIKSEVTQGFATYRLDFAAKILYEFVWNEYCDWYVEAAKVQLQLPDEHIQQATRLVLVRVLEEILRLLQPLMPFISAELWQVIAPLAAAEATADVIIAPWPAVDKSLINHDALQQMAGLQELVGAIRNLKIKMNLSPAQRPPLLISGAEGLLQLYRPYLPPLAKVGEVAITDAIPADLDLPLGITAGAKFVLKVTVDSQDRRRRLVKELEKTQKTAAKLAAKLAQPGYRQKAPKPLVAKDTALLAENEALITALTVELNTLSED